MKRNGVNIWILPAVQLWLALAAAAATDSVPASDERKQLKPDSFQIERNEDSWNGRFTYNLVVGTFFEWNTDPTAIPGLFSELRRRTGIRPRVEFTSVSLSGEELFDNPFLMLTGNRFFRLSPAEIENLRAYLFAGGALYADDCGGADFAFRSMLKRLLPDSKLEMVPLDHPVYSMFYKLSGPPKILDLYGTEAQGLGVFIDDRLAVFYTYDTDVPCGWEKNPDGSFVHKLSREKHEASIRMGVNVVLYFLSQLSGLEPAAELTGGEP